MKKLTGIILAAATVLGLSACGAKATTDTESGVVLAAIDAMSSGDYAQVAALCSPATKGAGMAAVVLVKAFDPTGAFLKAAGADLKADFDDNGVLDTVAPEEFATVKVNGKWYLDCSN